MDQYRYVGEELGVFAHAVHWKDYVRSLIGDALTGDVLEVGAGIGTATLAWRSPRQRTWTCVEPDRQLATTIADRTGQLSLPVRVLHGTTRDLGAGERFTTVLYLDVLEHIEDDAEELRRAAGVLAPGGRLIVLSPAHQWLYTAFDRRIGHCRRYSRESLAAVAPAGLVRERLLYLDAAGALLSLGNRVVLRSDAPTLRQVETWDRWFVPISRYIDGWLGYRVGKSVLGIWRRHDA